MADQQEADAIRSLQQAMPKNRRTVLVADDELFSTNERASLAKYLANTWRYRHFIFEHARFKAAGDNDDMFLGKLWNILEPLLRIAMYGVMFGVVLQTSRGIENFVGFLVIGLMYFSMMSRGLGSGSGLVQRSKAMMRTFRFPRVSLVVGEAIKGFISNIIPGALAVLAALAFQWGNPLSWSVVLIVPIYFLIHLFSFGLLLISARVTAFVPDAKKIVFFVNRAWFYVSGVFFSVERYARVPEMQEVMQANPAYRFLEAARSVVMYNQIPSLSEWLVLVLWATGASAVGFIFFWRAEDRYVHVR
ncbi:ABC transporter permease [Corynebacterium sp. HMSC05D03]|uniref:ABC transporter permease n=1 Tax=Corynebacterium sp. HMSC05D03 TaxID=1581115 RepID=UPI0008A50C77|nr:ABC transporter permease [Corynebacterium sp. HMSC05D03]OFT65262.1 ABC transporter permease [Corynebacterium sp. HMSC05D03]